MLEQKRVKKFDIKFLGIKIYEIIEEQLEIFDHKFKNDREEQEVLAESARITKKILGIPYVCAEGYNDSDGILN